MKHWYTYKITFVDDTFYIGYRGTVKLPEEDFLVLYFSSSKIVKQKIWDGCEYNGVILQTYDNQSDAYTSEQNLIFEEISNPKILNRFCYKDRKGFGLLTESARIEIARSSKERWADPLYKERLIKTHKSRWTDELKERQVLRLTGKKRPEHSAALTGRKNPAATITFKGKSRPDGFGAKVSAATKGVPKSEQHRKNLSGPKPRICRLTDRKEMSVNHFTRWIISLAKENHSI